MLQVILEKTSAPALTRNSVDLTFRFDAAINMGFHRGKKLIRFKLEMIIKLL